MNNMEEQLEQSPAKKSRTDNSQEEPENGQGNDATLDQVLGTSTMNLASSRRPLELPLEVICEIFKFLELPTQRKFVLELGPGIYEMFGPKFRLKICNPHANRWNASNRNNMISPDGLRAQRRDLIYRPLTQTKVYAEQAFPIAGQHSPGTICYYYEAIIESFLARASIGLSDGAIPDREYFHRNGYQNAYATDCDQKHPHRRNVYGCGLLLFPNAKLTIFFTLNGKLLGYPSLITPSVDRLFPTVSTWDLYIPIEANFGDDPAKPFEFDVHTCPNWGLP